MAATVSNPYHFPPDHMGTDQQMIMCSILQEAVISLCQANYPRSAQLEVDAIICISVLSSTEQHVVKIHEKLNETDLNVVNVAENQSNTFNILTKQNIIGQEAVKLKNFHHGRNVERTTDMYMHDLGHSVDENDIVQHRFDHSHHSPGRLRMAHIKKKRILDSGDSFPAKVTRNNSFRNEPHLSSVTEPVVIKVEPDDSEDVSKASSALDDEVHYDNSGEVVHSGPRPTALFRTDFSAEPPDKNSPLSESSSVELLSAQQTFSRGSLEPDQFSFVDRKVSSTITHDPDFRRHAPVQDATNSHFVTEKSVFSLNPKVEMQNSASRLDDHDATLNASEQENLSRLSTDIVQGVDEQYMQSLPSNEDDVQGIEDREEAKFEEQAEASEIVLPTDNSIRTDGNSSKELVKQEFSANIPIQIYSCEECNITFVSKDHFTAHQQGSHFVPCVFCNRLFPSRHHMLLHSEVDHSRNLRESLKKSRECSQEKMSIKKMQRNPDLSNYKKCEKCDKSFKNKATLNCHVRAVHKPPGDYVCACGKVYRRAVNLRRHTTICNFTKNSSSSCH